MNKLLFGLIIILATFFSCSKKVSCPEKELYLSIALANNTDYIININLYQKQEYLDGNDFYRGSDYCGCFKKKNLTLDT